MGINALHAIQATGLLVLQKLLNCHLLLFIPVTSRWLFIAGACAESIVFIPRRGNACRAPSETRWDKLSKESRRPLVDSCRHYFLGNAVSCLFSFFFVDNLGCVWAHSSSQSCLGIHHSSDDSVVWTNAVSCAWDYLSLQEINDFLSAEAATSVPYFVWALKTRVPHPQIRSHVYSDSTQVEIKAQALQGCAGALIVIWLCG